MSLRPYLHSITVKVSIGCNDRACCYGADDSDASQMTVTPLKIDWLKTVIEKNRAIRHTVQFGKGSMIRDNLYEPRKLRKSC